jgi:hypothetical protein
MGGQLLQGRTFQVKGVPYAITDLLGDPALAAHFEGGSALTIYLAPGDYHRFHAPFALRLLEKHDCTGSVKSVSPSVEPPLAAMAENRKWGLVVEACGEKRALSVVGAVMVGGVSFAEKLLERHIKQIDELSSGPGAPENEHVDKERKIVERLGARGPMKYRDLVRTFSDQSTNSPTSWSWDFGDTETSTAQNPSHTYASAGVYTVTLTATNSCGSDDEIKTDYITVTEPSAFCDDFEDGDISDWTIISGSWSVAADDTKYLKESSKY